jgi:hypothetical protein
MASCRRVRISVDSCSVVKISLLYPAEPNRGMRYDPLLYAVLNLVHRLVLQY